MNCLNAMEDTYRTCFLSQTEKYRILYLQLLFHEFAKINCKLKGSNFIALILYPFLKIFVLNDITLLYTA